MFNLAKDIKMKDIIATLQSTILSVLTIISLTIIIVIGATSAILA